MQTTEKPVQHVKGGSFLVESHHADQVFTPEDFQEEHYMMAETAEQFIDSEIMPRMAELETCNNDLTASILKKAGDLGMLAAEIPESYGGLNLSKAAACLVSEKFSRTGGLIVSLGGHCGIGTMPITYFGTQEQKDRYLPKLATGELLAAYALTETSSGSDALSARTKAVLSADGSHYVLNGNKMWITNAGFADVFIVFAKIDGTDFSAFIVERN
ncbi:MAG: acyl-CoA dehydrogenase family protein, partial [Acidobacteria bacterium]|nr:acyl-CoA dehydrogenase family protein [Acidobacteriota bacterium]